MDGLPTFVVIGAAKSGTSALYNFLRQHPEIRLPAHQEPSFFSFEGQELKFRGPGEMPAAINYTAITSLDRYRALYEAEKDDRGYGVSGDISPAYLYWPGTAERMRAYSPNMCIIVLLRNPAERAYSAFMHARREGKEPFHDFADALRAEARRIDENWGFMWRYVDLGRYARQLRRYYDVFDSRQIKVFLYEDFKEDPARVCAELQSHIGVDPRFVPDTSLQFNVSGIPHSRKLHQWLSRESWLGRAAARTVPLLGKERLRRWQTQLANTNLERVPLESAMRQELSAYFREEVWRLERLIGRDLSAWLQ